MAIPKFSELSPTIQIVLIVVVGAALWGVSEYIFLKPTVDANSKKQEQINKLNQDLAPLRPFEQKQKTLIAENRQLEIQLANLRQIVPDEKEVDSFIRLVEGASNGSGIQVRRFTVKPAVIQDYYVEAPFEVEMDGPYYQVLDFYDRLSKLARIVNISDLKMASIDSGKSVGNKVYPYGPNESVVAVCTITTFFSREEGASPPPAKPGQPANPPAKK